MVLTVMNVKNIIFWDTATYYLVDRRQHFTGMYWIV